jgi:hypothetical protein
MDTIELADGGILLYQDAFLSPDVADRYFVELRHRSAPTSWVRRWTWRPLMATAAATARATLTNSKDFNGPASVRIRRCRSGV